MSRTVVKFRGARKTYSPSIAEISTWASARISLLDWAWHYWNAETERWITGIEFVNTADAVAFKLTHLTLIAHE